MRRLGVALFAFLLGLCGSVAVVYVVDSANQVDDRDLLGPADIDAYCRALYGDRAIALLTRPTIDGWQCASRSNGIFATQSVQFDELCPMQYDRASYAAAGDPDWPVSWECYEGSKP